MRLSRRSFLRTGTAGLVLLAQGSNPSAKEPRPNIIFAMTDDQGWGDSGYNGHPILQTPTLDEMSRSGIRFDRFYSGSPVCSPTRGSCLTGRHPERYGIVHANYGDYDAPSMYPLPEQEITLAEALKTKGYTTGHFGKWHLGDFHGEMKSSPSDNGFDVSFSTVRKVPTLDPFGYYLNGILYRGNLKGDDSRIIMDRAISFIRNAVRAEKPFFVVVWFHTPHVPFIASPAYRSLYTGHSEEEQNFWGALTAMDREMGRLRSELHIQHVAENTMLWFCSDNGARRGNPRFPGSVGGLRGGKGNLYEGGIRVPGILEWPGRIEQRVVETPCSTLDYYPTILEILGIKIESQPRPIDGISLVPLLKSQMKERPKPIGFQFGKRAALVGNRYKILVDLENESTESVELYDLLDDPTESNNLADGNPKLAQDMKSVLDSWRESCRESLAGEDY